MAASMSARTYGTTNDKVNPSPTHTSASVAEKKEKKFVPVMVTPFSGDGKIDFNALDRLVDFYLGAGVKGLFANCLSSEMYHLSADERLSLTQHIVKRVNSKLPVVATGSFGSTMDERVLFTKKIYDTGINAVILISSHYATKEESDSVLLRNMEQMVARTGDIPLGLYECPSPYKRILTPEVFKVLLDTKRFIYHKDTSIDQDKVKAKLDLLKNNPLEFYDAHTANAIFSLQHGAKGLSAIAGNFYPEVLVWMCEHATDQSRQKEVKWMQTELDKAEDLISDNYPISSKYFLNKRGVAMELVSRSSTQPLTTSQRKTLDDVYNMFLGWCERIGVDVRS